MSNLDSKKASAIVSLKPELIGKFGVKSGQIILHDPLLTLPSEAEIQTELDRLIADQSRKEAESARATAYRNEADPLYFKAQRGEATIEEWQLKVAAIRSLYPYPEETES